MTGEAFALQYYNTAILKRSLEQITLRRCGSAVGDLVVLWEVIMLDLGKSELNWLCPLNCGIKLLVNIHVIGKSQPKNLKNLQQQKTTTKHLRL